MNQEMIFALYLLGPIFAVFFAVSIISLFKKSQAERIAKALEFLRDSPKTIQEIADHLGIWEAEALDVLNVMLDKCYISESIQSCWDNEGGVRKPVRIYSITPVGLRKFDPPETDEPVVKKIKF
jgi:hypothetical protein